MNVTILGAARQVGRSACLVKDQNSKLVIDFGVLPGKNREPTIPMHIQPNDVDGLLLSHAHLDHTGAAPLFYLGKGVPLYTSPLSADLSSLLIEDFLRISGFYLPFQHMDLLHMLKNLSTIETGKTVSVKNFNVTFNDAGHIPGSSTILIESGKKRILYTGDVNGDQTQLLKPLFQNYGELDMIITESTYGTSDHSPREEVEQEFVQYAKEVVERGGTLLVPAFSVGRAQEIACVLRAYDFPYVVAMDGMALKTNNIFLKHPEFIRDASHLERTIDGLEIIKSWGARKKIVQTPSVIIAPAGMLVGGSSAFYSAKIAEKSKNGISIVSFQAPNTPGKTLLEQGYIKINGKRSKVKAEVRRFEFSSHSGKTQLFDMLKSIKGDPTVVAVHGDEPTLLEFASSVKEELKLNTLVPNPGDEYEV